MSTSLCVVVFMCGAISGAFLVWGITILVIKRQVDRFGNDH